MKKFIYVLLIIPIFFISGCQNQERVQLNDLSLTKIDSIEKSLTEVFKHLNCETLSNNVVISKSEDGYNTMYKKDFYFDHIIKATVISKDLNSHVNMIILEYPDMYFDVINSFLKSYVAGYNGNLKNGDNIYGNIRVHLRKNILTSAKKIIISNLDEVDKSQSFDYGNKVKSYFELMGDLVYLLNFDDYKVTYFYKDFVNNIVDIRARGKYKDENFDMAYREVDNLGSYKISYKNIKTEEKLKEIEDVLKYKFSKKQDYVLVRAGNTLTLEYKIERK